MVLIGILIKSKCITHTLRYHCFYVTTKPNLKWLENMICEVFFLVNNEFGKIKDISCPCMIKLMHRLHLKKSNQQMMGRTKSCPTFYIFFSNPLHIDV